MYVKKIRDLLRSGVDFRTAQLSLGSGTSAMLIQAQEPGLTGNTITIQVTVPTVTAGLTVTVAGTAITIALDQTNGTVNNANNTAALILAAVAASAPAAALVRVFLIGDGTGFLSVASGPTALAGGAQGSNAANIQTMPLNFLKAQDMSTVLDMFQQAVSQTATMTAQTGSSATSIVRVAGTFVPNTQVGNQVVFAANTTTVALRGVVATILANDNISLTVATLPAAVVNGDTFTIVANFISSDISKLRQGEELASSPRGNIYGDYRIVQNALAKVTQQLALTAATGLLTFAGQPANADTITIGAKTYTFQTVLTNVDGNVLIGASATTARDNLIAAIMLGAGSGTTYAAATTLNADVRAVASGANMSVVAKAVGTAPNSVATTKVSVNTSWGAATLTGGTFGSNLREPTMATLTTGVGSTATNIVTTRTDLRIDQFKGMKLTMSGQSVDVIGNNTTSLIVFAKWAAPTNGVTLLITVGADDLAANPTNNARRTHPGGQYRNNRVLADHIAQAEAAVVAFTLPT